MRCYVDPDDRDHGRDRDRYGDPRGAESESRALLLAEKNEAPGGHLQRGMDRVCGSLASGREEQDLVPPLARSPQRDVSGSDRSGRTRTPLAGAPRNSGFPSLLYFDASAFTKLVREEDESEALWRFVGDARITSSRLLIAEAPRALRRIKAENPRLELDTLLRNSERLLQTTVLRPLDPFVLREAGALPEPRLGSLDAIHVATAVRLRPLIDAFVTYDQRQGAVALEVGLHVVAPGSA
jgi:uncharacterized protein